MLAKVPLNYIITDIKPRVNVDNGELESNMRFCGQIQPLIVEGPDSNGNYYLIKGFRRLEVMNKFPEEFPIANCLILRPLTTQDERNKMRFSMLSPSKKLTKFEHQVLFENINKDEEILKTLPYYKRKRIEKGLEIPESERNEVAINRASQEALWVIYNLECDESYKENLKSRLNQRLITTEHATAIKKLVKNKYYSRLQYNFKPFAIEKAIKVGKFSEETANLIILEEIMKNEPYPDLAEIWAQYFYVILEEKFQIMNPSLRQIISDETKASIRSLVDNYLGWLWDEENLNDEDNAKKSQKENNGTYSNIVKENKIVPTKKENQREIRIERCGNILKVLFEKADNVFQFKS